MTRRLTSAEVCDRWDIKPSHLWKLVQRGELYPVARRRGRRGHEFNIDHIVQIEKAGLRIPRQRVSSRAVMEEAAGQCC